MGMEFLLKWHFSCRTWVRWSIHSFISFTFCSFRKRRFNYQSLLNPNTVAEGEPVCRRFLLHRANRTSDDGDQGHDLCNPVCIFGGWEVGAWPDPYVRSCSGCVRLITGQCHFWMLSKGLDWGSDCKMRPLLLRREPANKSEACEQVVPLRTWTDWLKMMTCRQDPTAVNSVYLLQSQLIVRICSHWVHIKQVDNLNG